MSETVHREVARLSRGGKLAELIAQHAPYLSKHSDNRLCLRCLDDSAHGEFTSVDDWAVHLATELAIAGYGKRR